MNYQMALARLREIQERPDGVVTKVTEPPFVTFVTPPPRDSGKILALVRCGDCAHFRRDPVNPAGGLGSCGIGADGEPGAWGYRPTFPFAPRRCGEFRGLE